MAAPAHIARENGKKGGRPRGIASIKSEEARKVLAQMVFDEITPLGKRLIKEAEKGNVQAFKELFDRAFGKAPQAVDVTSDGEKLMIAISEVIAKKNGIE